LQVRFAAAEADGGRSAAQRSLAKHGQHSCRAERFAEEEALAVAATELGKAPRLLARLDAFCDDVDAARNQTPLPYSARDEWWVMNDDGCSLYVAEFGQGPPVVIVHDGFGAEHSYMLDAFSGLAWNGCAESLGRTR